MIELSGEERHRGLLDPMRVGTEETREDLAYNFLASILPGAGASPSGRPSCGSRSPRRSPPARAAAARWCARIADSRRSRGGRGGAGDRGPRPRRSGQARTRHRRAAGSGSGDAEVVSLRIANLTLPLAGTARSELLEEERISLAVLRLLAAYALRLCATDPDRHSVLAMDEAWALTLRQPGSGAAGADQPPGSLAEHHPDPRHPDARRRRELEPLVGALLRLRGGDRGARRGRRSGCCAWIPTMRAPGERLIGLSGGALPPARLRGPGGAGSRSSRRAGCSERLDTTPGA